jgi:hypothetical protein
MNHCLAEIGIQHADHRPRAIDIDERLEVLKDYPTPPNCTSPFAPIWIAEIVSRQDLGWEVVQRAFSWLTDGDKKVGEEPQEPVDTREANADR